MSILRRSSMPAVVVPMTLALAIATSACGDSSGTGGAGGTGTTSASTSSSSSSKASSSASTSGATTSSTTGASTSSGGATCAMLSTKADCRNCCGSQNPAGNKKLIEAVTNACGCTMGGTCASACQSEPFCTDHTSGLGNACNTCISQLQGTETCAMTGLQACQADVECAAAEQCQLSCLPLP